MVVALFAKGRSHLVPAMVSAVPLSSMRMLVMLSQFWKATSPMFVTEAGILMLVKPVLRKASLPMVVSVEGRVTDFSLPQFLKAFAPMLVTLLPIVTTVSVTPSSPPQ